ncbi:MAG: helix-turn-helix transcriptional regulator [Clostridiales bacterium]|nr:helix-turn-helix transcriptional regulator [Clostridiales bacterium]
MPKQTIGEFLATQRKAKGYTQQQVADMIGVSNRTLSSWEQGRSYPDIMILPALAEIFGVTVDEILSGERLEVATVPAELTEKSQKKIFKNALAKYSVKCTALSAIGIASPVLFILSILLLSVSPAWLTILLWILAAIDMMVVAVLFAVFEKSALIIDEDNTRYTLAIKRSTYRGVFCIAMAILPCILIFMIFALNIIGNIFATGTILSFGLLIPFIIFIVILALLRNRGKELYTDSERELINKNDKFALKLTLISVAVIIVLSILASVFGFVNFPISEDIVSLNKDGLSQLQTVPLNQYEEHDYEVESEDGFYFIDVAAALNKEPINFEEFGLHGLYHIDGNLYLYFNPFGYWEDDYQFSQCAEVYYVFYVDDGEKAGYKFACVFSGSAVYLDGYDAFSSKYPNESDEDYRTALLNNEVTFCFDGEYFAHIAYMTHTIFGAVTQNGSSEYLLRQDGENYTLVWQSSVSYGGVASGMAIFGSIVTIIVCISVYFAKRKKIVITL